MSDTNWGMPHTPYVISEEWDDYISGASKWKWCQHQWLDLGMRRTYCKHCEVKGDRNYMTGEIVVIPPAEKESK